MKTKFIFFIFGMLLIGSMNFVSPAEVSYCCEKTESGAWCQNAPENECASGFRKTPTSCESTSYCRKGCCYDSQEGTCMENSPEKTCEDKGGIWEEDAECDIPQCTLGCCLIGDQAAFVTQTRCKRLSSLYGLEIDFRTNIGNEIQCIASATSEVKGACVFEEEFETTCKFITQRACQDISDSSFYLDKLCSDDSLATNCGPSEKTTCVEGRDEVYFVDTCGNLANIYDASKQGNKNYWADIKTKSESCNPGGSNAGSATCGNCDYFLGSTCKDSERSDSVNPNFGDYICKDLSCEYENRDYQHGETWCADSKGISENLPGSRHFRMVCYNGEVTVEPCADFRQEICIEDSVNDFSTAACRANQWQDCFSQTDQKDCENLDRRDCKWIESSDEGLKCVPAQTPGFDFWSGEGDAQSLCSQANTECTVVFEKGLTGSEKCIENCECLGDGWQDKMNNMCIAIGDCGVSVNYLGAQGYN